MENNANHIIPLYCNLSVNCRSLVDQWGSLESHRFNLIIMIKVGYSLLDHPKNETIAKELITLYLNTFMTIGKIVCDIFTV